MTDGGNRNLTIIYYRSFSEVVSFVGTNLAEHNQSALFCDLDDQQGFGSPLSVEDKAYEQACVDIAGRIDTADNCLEKALIYEYLQAHYPRLVRYLGAFSRSNQTDIVCFIDAAKYNLFDQALSYEWQTCFYDLKDKQLHQIDPGTLVVPYCKSPLAKDLIQLADDIIATVKQQHFVPRYYEDLDYDNHTFVLESQAQWRCFCEPTRQSRHTKGNKTLFVAATNEYDLYLKPLYPVWQEMDRRALPYRIMSSNTQTDACLERKQLVYEPSMVRTLPAAQPIKGALVMGALLSMADKPIEGLIDYLVMLALNSSFIPPLLNRISHYKTAAEQLYHEVGQVFYVPDGTPDAFCMDLFKPKAVSSYTLVAAAITDRYNTIVRYMAETIFCYGRQCERTIAHFFPDKKTILSGNPNLYVYDSEPMLQPFEKKPYALIATSHFDGSEAQWINALLANIDADKMLLVIKPHPFYKDSYRQYEDRLNGHILLEAQQNIDPYVKASRLVITDHSQVGRDAHLLGKPVISMSLVGRAPYLADVDSIIACDTIDKLTEQVKYYAKDSNACQGAVSERFIDDYNYGGKAEHFRVVVDHLGQSESIADSKVD